MNEWLIEQKEAENLIRWSLKFPSFIYLFFFQCISVSQYKILHNTKNYWNPKCMAYLLGPRHCMRMAGLSLEELAVLEVRYCNLIPYNKESDQTASNLLFAPVRTRVIYGCAFPQLWKEFYNQLWSHFSKAELFWDALKTAHLCMFCFTCWATNIIFTVMKAVLLWIFLGKKILFADQYLCIMDNSII